MTDFDYYTQFKFSQKEIDMLNFYINYEPAQADKNDAQNILNQVIEYNELMNNLNRNRIADQYKDYNLTTKIQAYEKKLLEKTNLYYELNYLDLLEFYLQTINSRCNKIQM